MMPDAMFLTNDQLRSLSERHSTPFFVYGKAVMSYYAQQALNFKTPYGTTVRYAVKANPHKKIIQLFNKMGLFFDASSGGEADLLLNYGISADKIALNSQEIPKNLKELVYKGVHFTATSLHQLEVYGAMFPGAAVGVRLNPGVGSGETNKVTTGGYAAGFGIWHEYIDEIHKLSAKHRLGIDKVHTHIGAGTDPSVWQAVASITLKLADRLPSATTISLGGGFKVDRMGQEPMIDMANVGQKITTLVADYAHRTGRELHVEIEPGTFLTAMGGLLVATVIDITDTGKQGYQFIRVNTGMNDILRPTLYGAQHPIWIVPGQSPKRTELADYVIIGHNCESGDLLTPKNGQPDTISPRRLPKPAIGDLVVIGGAGAYCASMRAVGYNTFLPATELFI